MNDSCWQEVPVPHPHGPPRGCMRPRCEADSRERSPDWLWDINMFQIWVMILVLVFFLVAGEIHRWSPEYYSLLHRTYLFKRFEKCSSPQKGPESLLVIEVKKKKFYDTVIFDQSTAKLRWKLVGLHAHLLPLPGRLHCLQPLKKKKIICRECGEERIIVQGPESIWTQVLSAKHTQRNDNFQRGIYKVTFSAMW